MTKTITNQYGQVEKEVKYDLTKEQQFIAMGQMILAYEAIEQFKAKLEGTK